MPIDSAGDFPGNGHSPVAGLWGSPESWLQEQMQYELWDAQQHKGKINVRKLEAV